MDKLKDENRKEKLKKIGTNILQGLMGGISVLVNPKKASEAAIDSTAKKLGNWKRQRELDKEYLGRYVFANLISNPANVIWGEVVEINLRDAGEYDLVVQHLQKPFKQYVRMDNTFLIKFFESRDNLFEYVNDEIKKGNMREGSLRITAKGAREYGSLILQSLEVAILDDIEIKKEIPESFLWLIREAQEQFSSTNELIVVFFNSDRIPELSSHFPLESIVVLSAINNVFMMRNLAIVSDD